MRLYQKLEIWQLGVELVKHVYVITNSLPDEEKFGLTSQLRRSAVSIPSNIAEGYGRGSDKDFRRFLLIARGSLYELETQLIIASELNFIKRSDDIGSLIQHLFAKLNNLSNKLTS